MWIKTVQLNKIEIVGQIILNSYITASLTNANVCPFAKFKDVKKRSDGKINNI